MLHLIALVVVEHHVQCKRVDEQGLHERDNVDIPVYARAPCQVLIGVGKEVGAYEGGDDGLDGLIEERCEEDFMDVVRQGGELKA